VRKTQERGMETQERGGGRLRREREGNPGERETQERGRETLERDGRLRRE